MTIISLLISLCAFGNDYNPENPPEPTFTASVTLSAYPAGSGSVSGEGRYTVGSTVYVSAYNYTDWEFVCWKEGEEIVSTSYSYSFTILKNRSLTAHYEYSPSAPSEPEKMNPSYRVFITSNLDGAGYFNHNSGTRFEAGKNVSLYAYTYSDYVFKHWKKEGKIISNHYALSFNMEWNDMNLEAVYEYDPSSPGEPTSDMVFTLLKGDSLTISRNQYFDYEFLLHNDNFPVSEIEFDMIKPAGLDADIWSVVKNQRIDNHYMDKYYVNDSTIHFRIYPGWDTYISSTRGSLFSIRMNAYSLKEEMTHTVKIRNARLNGSYGVGTEDGRLYVISNSITSVSDVRTKEIIIENKVIKADTEIYSSIRLYNLSGRVVAESATGFLELYDIPKGIYIVRANGQYGNKIMKIFND